jgi:hypothetical protein
MGFFSHYSAVLFLEMAPKAPGQSGSFTGSFEIVAADKAGGWSVKRGPVSGYSGFSADRRSTYFTNPKQPKHPQNPQGPP